MGVTWNEGEEYDHSGRVDDDEPAIPLRKNVCANGSEPTSVTVKFFFVPSQWLCCVDMCVLSSFSSLTVLAAQSLLPSFMHILGRVSGQMLTTAERTTVVLDTFPRLLAGTVATFAKPRVALALWKGALWKDTEHARYQSQPTLLLHPAL